MKCYHTIETSSKVEKIAFSYTNENIIASTHTNGVCIWDLRKGDKVPLKSHKFNNPKILNLEFDRVNGLLLLLGQKKVHIYSENNFNHPLEINRSNIKNAKFVPSESGFAMIEKKNRNEISHNINFYSLSSENNDLVVKEINNLALPKKEDIKEFCFRRDQK